MADVIDSTQAAEPSMEEILASIRKIIADDGVPPPAGTAESDVIELTQMVQDDGTVVDVNAPVPEEPLPPPAPPEVTPPPPPVVEPPAPPPPPKPDMPPVKAAAGAGLMSETVEKAAVSSFSSLASTVQIDRLAGAGYVGNGSRTLEDMVTELMRPLLKEWLDQNLPATVDRLVQKEIERIARRAND